MLIQAEHPKTGGRGVGTETRMLRDIQGKVLEAASVGKQQGIQLGKKQEVLTFL